MLKKRFIPTPLPFRRSESRQLPAPIRAPRNLFLLWLLVRVVWHVWMMRLSSRDRTRALGQLVRSEFERLGGFWIKAGRALAAGVNDHPQSFREELSKIRDDAPSLSGELVKDILNQDLGGAAKEVIREFDVVPVATTSLGQLHVAWLVKNDVKLAIKVQRPGMHQAYLRDLALLSTIASSLRFFSLFRWAKLDNLEARLRRLSTLLLDYRNLAETMHRLRRELGAKKVYVPKVFRQLCTERLLVMEFIDGVPIVDYEYILERAPKKTKKWCRDNGIHPAKLRRRIEAFAGNWPRNRDVMMLRRNRIALVDFSESSIVDSSVSSKLRKP